MPPHKTEPSTTTQLILVEGLTGSGKSTLAHFVTRQLRLNGVAADWIHEGEVPHPLTVDFEGDPTAYRADAKGAWSAWIERVASEGGTWVVEASLFNNHLETLMANGAERQAIVDHADDLHRLMAPLRPRLIYLAPGDVGRALEKNFADRGPDFEAFVIDSVTSTPLARQRGWRGYEGMVRFWSHFVRLTDGLFARFPGPKQAIDTTPSDWGDHGRLSLAFLGIPFMPERSLSAAEAEPYVGRYRLRDGRHVIALRHRRGDLEIDLFPTPWTRLIPQPGEGAFVAEGWPYTLHLRPDASTGADTLTFSGRDVDYLPLVGTVADRIEAGHG